MTSLDDFRRRLHSGMVWSLTFQIASKSSLFIVNAFIARALAVQSLGRFAATQGLIILLVAVVDRGNSLFLERNIASRRLRKGAVRTQILSRCAEAAVALAIACLVFASVYQFNLTTSLAFSAAFGAMMLSGLINGVLQGFQEFRASALTMTAGRVVYLSAVVSLFAVKWLSLTSAAVAWAFGEFTIACSQAALYMLLQRRKQSGYARHLSAEVPFDYAVKSYWRMTLRALPYWLSVIAFVAYNRADTAIVLFFSNSREAGFYAPATAIQTALMVIPAALTGAMAVVGAAALTRGNATPLLLMAEAKRLSVRAMIVSVVLAASVFALAPLIIKIFAGAAYGPAVTPTRIIVWSLPFNAVEFTLLGLLIAFGRPGKATLFYVVTLIASITCNAILTPRYGAVGGAIAAVVREPIGCGILAWFALRVIRLESGGGAARAVQPAAVP